MRKTYSRKFSFPSWLSRHNIPLLRSRDNDLGLRDFGLRQLHITYNDVDRITTSSRIDVKLLTREFSHENIEPP